MKREKRSRVRKLRKLKEILAKMKGVLVAYSGGVDSMLLLKVARDVLGDSAFAVIASSPTYPPSELVAAARAAGRLGVRYTIVKTGELENPRFSSNPVNRCYYCKRELFSNLKRIAGQRGLRYILDGSNLDDARDFRPGNRAKTKFGIRSPLKEAGLTKDDIRALSKKLNLPTWNKPSLACLASRFPYGASLNKKDLKKVNTGEGFLRKLGFKQVRVRHYAAPAGLKGRGDTARIEFLPSEIKKALNENTRKKIVRKFKSLGYIYVALDLEGYRTGSMNEPLRKKKRGRNK